MFELKFKRITLAFDFSFFAVMSLMILFSDNKYIIMCFVVCLWHETGHLIMFLINDIKVRKISFYGAGIKITPEKSLDFTPFRTHLEVLIAGSALNFITFILLENSEYSSFCVFAAINASIGAFNLLPLHFLDGGKILILIIRALCNYQRSVLLERFVKWINIIMIILVILCFAFVGKGNITLFATLCCLLFSAIMYNDV